MIFSHPEFFFLLPALILLGWKFKSLRLFEPLRAIALLLCILALAGPTLKLAGGGLDLWVLVDRSESAANTLAIQGPEIEAILNKSKGLRDQLHLVDYGVDAVRREQGDPEFRGGSHQTRTGAAIEFTLAQLDPVRSSRLLVVSDGYATEPLDNAGERLLRSGVPMDHRLLIENLEDDARITALELPTRVVPGEAFLIEFRVTGAVNTSVPWELKRGGGVLAKGTLLLRDGAGHVRLADRLGGSGAVRYELQIKPARDKYPQNNHSTAWIEVAGGPRALLLSLYPDDPIAALLRAQGLDVVQVASPNTLTAVDLTRTRLVIINNIPAARIAPEFLSALPFFVQEQGGGLLMVGGHNSFGSGGYFSSAIDPLLPVSMELKTDHRKLATAMAIVMDRSGSMNASAGGGLRKMDLANAGAARAIELLGAFDAVSVHAVDTAPHEIVSLSEVAPNRDSLLDSVRRIYSMGAGIYIEEGLQAGWDQLKLAKTGQRHLILFADANDSAQHPGDYARILEEMRKEGATVSVIGMGNDTDKDAHILKDVAEKGGGRVYFNADPNELPAMFAQETVSVARSAFITEQTPTKATASWGEIGVRTPKWMQAVDSYNLSYLRPNASVALLTTDEYQAPLVAFWSRGAGRSAAVSFPLGGTSSASIRAWDGYGDFVQTLTRWLAGEDAPAGLALKTNIQGEQLSLELLHDESWTDKMAMTPPSIAIVESGIQRGQEPVRNLVWERMEPGRFRCTFTMTPGKPLRGVVRIGTHTLPFGPLSAAGASEWTFDAERKLELQQLSTRSGGQSRLDLAAIWDAPRKAHERPLNPWVLTLLGLVILAEAALTRLGISLLPRRFRR